jgi:hypothetical protein
MGDLHALVVLGIVALFAPLFFRFYLVHLGRDVRLWLISAFLTGFCTMFGGTYGALMNLYLLKLGFGKDVIGGLNGAFYIGMAMLALVSGPVVRRVGGIRNCALLGVALVVLGQVTFPLPTLFGQTPSIAWLAATLMVASGGITLYAVNIWPFMASRIAPEKRAYGFAGHLGLVPVGGMVGTLLSGELATLLSGSSEASARALAITLALSGGLMLGAFVSLLAIGKERASSAAHGASTSARTPTGPMPTLIIAMMVVVMIFDVSGEGIGRVFQNVYMTTDLGLDTQTVSVLLSYGQLVAALAVFTTPILIVRLGLAWTFILTTLGMSFGLAVVSTIPHFLAAGAGYALLIGFSQMARAAKTQYAMEIVEEHYRPHISGFMQFAETGTVFLLASAGGLLLERQVLSFPALFNAVALSTALAAVWFWLFFVRTPRGELAQA